MCISSELSEYLVIAVIIFIFASVILYLLLLLRNAIWRKIYARKITAEIIGRHITDNMIEGRVECHIDVEYCDENGNIITEKLVTYNKQAAMEDMIELSVLADKDIFKGLKFISYEEFALSYRNPQMTAIDAYNLLKKSELQFRKRSFMNFFRCPGLYVNKVEFVNMRKHRAPSPKLNDAKTLVFLSLIAFVLMTFILLCVFNN